MSEKTGIQWTDHTFNPWWGCTKISAGCANCYAETLAERFHPGAWGPRGQRHYFGDKHWGDPVRWNRAATKAGVRRRVFCSSMADVFEDHETAQGSARARLFALVEATPMLDWQLLTKRPENVRDMAPLRWLDGWPRNAWVGTSVENQSAADERIPALLDVPAAIRFLSVEPLLLPVDLGFYRVVTSERPIHWVIVGGESGQGARSCDVKWIRSVVQQCREAGVPCFTKQLGAEVHWNGCSGPGEHWPADTRHQVGGGFWRVRLRHAKGGDPLEWPDDLRVREFPS